MSEENNTQPEEQKKRTKCNCSGGAPAWMVTYSDLVTLLLTFFVLLMSMSNMDPVRFTEASSSLKEAFGMHSEPARVEFAIPILPSVPKSQFNPIQTQLTAKIHRKLKAQIEDLKLSDDIETLKTENNTIILRFNNTILFNPGDSRVLTRAYPTLKKIADIIRSLPMDLRVEGHTDNQDFSEKSTRNNWDLSINRAVSVVKFYEQGNLLPLDRMAAIGYGSKRPIVPNSSDANRALNRRVDFVLHVKNDSGTSPASKKTGRIPL